MGVRERVLRGRQWIIRTSSAEEERARNKPPTSDERINPTTIRRHLGFFVPPFRNKSAAHTAAYLSYGVRNRHESMYAHFSVFEIH